MKAKTYSGLWMKYVYAFNGMVFLKIIVTFGTFLVENVTWCGELAGPLPLMALLRCRWQMADGNCVFHLGFQRLKKRYQSCALFSETHSAASETHHNSRLVACSTLQKLQRVVHGSEKRHLLMKTFSVEIASTNSRKIHL